MSSSFWGYFFAELCIANYAEIFLLGGGKKGGKQGEGEEDEGKGEQLRLRLEINLDVEIQLKAKIHGDLTIGLLCVPSRTFTLLACEMILIAMQELM